ncbi:type II secretion system protein [Paenibacillus sp. FSL R10-2736]|uniref:type II secretion system protein n=1 Tax=Paenibacillus sp. FSL R10-2736 TaxID=2954692 RepID=UPI0030F50260
MLAQAIKRRISKEENQKGFTLIELLAVIVILGIIAVIAIPMISGIIDNSKKDADLATARQIYEAARLYITSELKGDFTSKTVSITELQTKKYLESTLVLPSDKKTVSGGEVNFGSTGTLDTTNAVEIVTTTASVDSTKTYTAAQVLSVEK